jgi:hypothetical protein
MQGRGQRHFQIEGKITLGEKKMRWKRLTLLLLLVGLMVWGCTGTSGSMLQAPNQSGAGNPPTITASFAVDKGRFGDPIKVYLAAEHPTGVMKMVAVQVTQVGYGSYPTSWSILKPEYGKKFAGYFQWNTSSATAQRMPEWTNITMDITVIDTSGNQSKAVLLPYQFVTGATPSPVLPSPFDQAEMERIGWIKVDLVNPSRMRPK